MVLEEKGNPHSKRTYVGYVPCSLCRVKTAESPIIEELLEKSLILQREIIYIFMKFYA